MRAEAEEEGHLSCGGAVPAGAPHREGVEKKSPSLSPPALQFPYGPRIGQTQPGGRKQGRLQT